jgi:hypothetical protein
MLTGVQWAVTDGTGIDDGEGKIPSLREVNTKGNLMAMGLFLVLGLIGVLILAVF